VGNNSQLNDVPGFAPEELEAFRARVREQGVELYRDLPWRRTQDPYEIWISEVMLQQTQVSRVDGRWQRWLARFGSVAELARADAADVLDEWQGLGYNRRALAVHRAAQAIVAAGGEFPRETSALTALPGIGPATAAGIRAFAFDLHGVYLETNVRTVMLHELFAGREGVADRELVPLVEATCPPDGGFAAGEYGASGEDVADDPRSWYYAMLDYGAYLKRTVPNPSRRSSGHAKQSRFEGSRRQKRAALVRALLARREGASMDALVAAVVSEGIELDRALAAEILADLAAEGFCHESDGLWRP
jgi:A/G-specific adenine glycosylase